MSEKKETADERPADSADESSPQGEQPNTDESTEGAEQLRLRIEEVRKLADAYKDQFLRKAAEFDNYKRRTESDYLNVIRNASESVLLALLPIVEDFVRSLKAGKDQKDPEGFYKGVELIFQKLMKVLEAKGLVPFESVGKPFDVEFHDALLQMPRSDVPPHTVVEEVERGYKLNGRVLRHAKVIVSSPTSAPSEAEDIPATGDSEGADTRA